MNSYEKKEPYFCSNQFQPTDESGTHCLGNLAEGIMPSCAYMFKHIQIDPIDGKLYISMIKGSTGEGCCQDFEPLNPEGLVKMVQENSSLLKRCLRVLKGK